MTASFSWREVLAAGLVGIALPARAETGLGSNIGNGIGAVFLLGVILALYFLPTIIANSRAHTSTMAIVVLNTLVGWTVLGWIVALVWACSGKDNAAEVSRQRYAQMMAAKSAGSAAEALKTCPFCAESVKPTAIKCKHCGSDLRVPPPQATRA
jgi:hypothetical protein